ncbi:unnamed protein product [Spirodela intermedia]|uniref:RING-type E3 ubiquitin transferase n=1 Tax=Spirodela intermedia TaxID=51605 RepID=A0A7I8JQV9_SPIIN|nr:unnamed protein product [Spirodela intermedia]CAA6672534.1 unnamed protein product [Spirodela intermedia]
MGSHSRSIYSRRDESTLIDGALIRNESALLEGRQVSQGPEEMCRALMRLDEQSLDAADFMQMEECMMIDSVYHNMHQDMRLDVDTMSYEELLGLEEQIGNVSAGLTEDTVRKNLKRRKYPSSAAYRAESYCIRSGLLACGDDFHASCVGKWLVLKNVCPICKKTGLST